MDRYEALYLFWSSFGIPAYEVNSVPDLDVLSFPYITYEAAASPFDGRASLTASIWTRSTSWLQADHLADSVEMALRDGGQVLNYDSGILWITADEPFAQNMGDPSDDRIKRKQLAVTVQFY